MQSPSKPIQVSCISTLYVFQLADIRQPIYTLHSYILTEHVHPHNCFFLETFEMGLTKIVNFLNGREAFLHCSLKHTYKKQKGSLKTRAKLAVLRTYFERQVILEAILLYRASKCKGNKQQGSKDCLWTNIFTFL